MTISGLTNNFYLFNNKVIVVVNGFGSTAIKYLDILLSNNYTTKFTKARLYPINNEFVFDVSQMVKPTFNLPNQNVEINNNLVSIEFKATDNADVVTTQTIIKNFIRGGNFQGTYPDGTTKQNYLYEGFETNSMICEVPNFLPEIYYTTGLKNDTYIPNLIQMDIPCNGKYVKFLNQYGTYSFWYFDNFDYQINTKVTDSQKTIPYNFSENNFNDLGVTQNSLIVLKTKISYRFEPLMIHLILSPEVYIRNFENFTWQKVIQKSSKYDYNPIDKTFDYKIDFDFDDVLNPTLLWSN